MLGKLLCQRKLRDSDELCVFLLFAVCPFAIHFSKRQNLIIVPAVVKNSNIKVPCIFLVLRFGVRFQAIRFSKSLCLNRLPPMLVRSTLLCLALSASCLPVVLASPSSPRSSSVFSMLCCTRASPCGTPRVVDRLAHTEVIVPRHMPRQMPIVEWTPRDLSRGTIPHSVFPETGRELSRESYGGFLTSDDEEIEEDRTDCLTSTLTRGISLRRVACVGALAATTACAAFYSFSRGAPTTAPTIQNEVPLPTPAPGMGFDGSSESFQRLKDVAEKKTLQTAGY